MRGGWLEDRTMTAAAANSKPAGALAFQAASLRLNAKAANAASIAPAIEKRLLSRAANDVIVEIKAAGVNPSDVKAATGLMPYAVFPRTPGRDFAGTVVDGPPEWLGREVFGSSGDLGIRRDGTHATHLVVEAAALVEKPGNISMDEAAGVGVPFVTAIEGFRRAGMPAAQDTVLVMGLNGKVGQAATQLASWRGARVIGVVRRDEAYQGHANGPLEVINASTTDIAARVWDLTAGKGADIVFNTVGDPYFEAANKSFRLAGRRATKISGFRHTRKLRASNRAAEKEKKCQISSRRKAVNPGTGFCTFRSLSRSRSVSLSGISGRRPLSK